MRKRKLILAFVIMVLMFATFSISSSAIYGSTPHYEPDGSTTTVYEVSSSEANRTVTVNCVDGSGRLIKRIVSKTRYDRNEIISICINGYDIVNYECEQRPLATCKFTKHTGTTYGTYAFIQMNAHFISLFSKNELTATVTLRKSEPLDYVVRHYIEDSPGSDNYSLHSSTARKTINYNDYITTSKKEISGYTLKEGYESNISGNFSWNWVGKYKNMPINPSCFEYNLVKSSWSDYDEDRAEHNESKDGKLNYCIDRVCYIDYYYDTSDYTITYDANLGTGAPAEQTKYHNNNLTLSTKTPTRTGFTFKGWGTSSTSKTPSYYPGGTYTDNKSCTLYAIWEMNGLQTYSIKYNANGGTGAPSSQTKTKGVAMKLSTTQPTRSGYTFKGWATSSSATTASYQPGSTYSSDAPLTLYAVWSYGSYDFSISNLTVSDSNPYQYEQITVKVRTDSWDKENAYTDIPIQFIYGGTIVNTQYVDFSAYGVANLTFTLNVGSTIGSKTLEARINWPKHNNETRTTNNSVSTTINVQDLYYEMSINVVAPNADYTEGTTVMTSFVVMNDSDFDIIPSDENMAMFILYYYKGSEKIVIWIERWHNVVIPKGGANLIYFRWTVPEGLAGQTVYCECTINSEYTIEEANRDNNRVTYSTTVKSKVDSQTPNTRYESQPPNNYSVISAPSETTKTATWSQWEYENNAFVIKNYGVQISQDQPKIAPDQSCTTAVYENRQWTMKSGYGITMSYLSGVTSVSGYNMPEAKAYTAAQKAYVTFPEYQYSGIYGQYRTLDNTSGTFVFKENTYADENDRLHFIPVYVVNGDYRVSVSVSEMWTPSGMIYATRNSNSINVDGSIFDDFYTGMH